MRLMGGNDGETTTNDLVAGVRGGFFFCGWWAWVWIAQSDRWVVIAEERPLRTISLAAFAEVLSSWKAVVSWERGDHHDRGRRGGVSFVGGGDGESDETTADLRWV